MIKHSHLTEYEQFLYEEMWKTKPECIRHTNHYEAMYYRLVYGIVCVINGNKPLSQDELEELCVTSVTLREGKPQVGLGYQHGCEQRITFWMPVEVYHYDEEKLINFINQRNKESIEKRRKEQDIFESEEYQLYLKLKRKFEPRSKM